jgi:hypothetical protein
MSSTEAPHVSRMLVSESPLPVKLGGAVGGVVSFGVAESGTLGSDVLPAASYASTVYVYEVPNVTALSA